MRMQSTQAEYIATSRLKKLNILVHWLFFNRENLRIEYEVKIKQAVKADSILRDDYLQWCAVFIILL